MARTIIATFWEQVERLGDKTFIHHRVNKTGSWVEKSWKDVGQTVAGLAAGLLDKGVGQGDAVSILAWNRLEWTESDLAILSTGAMSVGIYPTNTPEEVEYVLNDCKARLVIVEDKEQLDKVLEVRGNCSQLNEVYVMQADFDLPEGVLPLSDLTAAPDLTRVRASADAVTPDDLLTLIYTSGTTGEPKGAMLTHGNLYSNVESTMEVIGMEVGEERNLSFLPLCHSFERMAGLYSFIYIGATIQYGGGVYTVIEDLPVAKPTVMTSVPRLYEKMYAKVHDQLEQAGGLKKAMANWAINLGMLRSELELDRKRVAISLRLVHALADKLVLSKLRLALTGGELKYFISGGAPLSAEIARFFFGIGIPVYEGYGLTETSPVLTNNRPGEARIGTVGKPIPGVEIRIVDEQGKDVQEGEIIARGPNIMKGYFNKPDKTAEVMADGWFYTGDIGKFDPDGFLCITDRKKDIIVTAGGKNIAPQMIENMLKTHQGIDQVAVIGDKRPYLIALVTIDPEFLQNWNPDHGLAADDIKGACEHADIQALVTKAMDEVNSHLARVERVKKFVVLPVTFSQATGELTPTLKVKRRIVMEKYATAIDALYAD